MTDGRLQWHPAFVAALHIEFEDELDVLEIKAERLLSKKPMQIDVLIIKKIGDKPIRKNIGWIFRRYNIIEYKSPEDSLSINDFYKVYGYTCFFLPDTKQIGEISPGELTITYVCNHYPRKLFMHLERKRRLAIAKKADGIYYLTGDEFSIQFIVTKELSKEENYWLQNLRNNLKAGPEIELLIENYEPQKQNPYYEALMDLIVRANWEEMEEARKMCNALRELCEDMYKDVLEEKEKAAAEQALERGLKQGMERGMKRGLKQGMERGEYRAKKIFKLFATGTPIELIAKQCDVSVEKVQQILE